MRDIQESLDRISYASTIKTGELAGSASATSFPDISCKMVNIKAVIGNSGNVYIGGSSSLTVVDGTTDITSGFELDAGQETGWMPISNLNKFWRITDNAGDDLTYIALL